MGISLAPSLSVTPEQPTSLRRVGKTATNFVASFLLTAFSPAFAATSTEASPVAEGVFALIDFERAKISSAEDPEISLPAELRNVFSSQSNKKTVSLSDLEPLFKGKKEISKADWLSVLTGLRMANVEGDWIARWKRLIERDVQALQLDMGEEACLALPPELEKELKEVVAEQANKTSAQENQEESETTSSEGESDPSCGGVSVGQLKTLLENVPAAELAKKLGSSLSFQLPGATRFTSFHLRGELFLADLRRERRESFSADSLRFTKPAQQKEERSSSDKVSDFLREGTPSPFSSSSGELPSQIYRGSGGSDSSPLVPQSPPSPQASVPLKPFSVVNESGLATPPRKRLGFPSKVFGGKVKYQPKAKRKASRSSRAGGPIAVLEHPARNALSSSDKRNLKENKDNFLANHQGRIALPLRNLSRQSICHSAVVKKKKVKDGLGQCLYEENTVGTAAHCLSDGDVVGLGERDLASGEFEFAQTTVKVAKIPNADMALFKVRMRCTSEAELPEIPLAEEDLEGEIPVLLETQSEVLMGKLGDSFSDGTGNIKSLNVDNSETRIGIHPGDSGTPLVAFNASGEPRVVGFLSAKLVEPSLRDRIGVAASKDAIQSARALVDSSGSSTGLASQQRPVHGYANSVPRPVSRSVYGAGAI